MTSAPGPKPIKIRIYVKCLYRIGPCWPLTFPELELVPSGRKNRFRSGTFSGRCSSAPSWPRSGRGSACPETEWDTCTGCSRTGPTCLTERWRVACPSGWSRPSWESITVLNSGKWLWLSCWQSFQLQRSTVRIQSSANFILNVYCRQRWKDENKDKRGRQWPIC